MTFLRLIGMWLSTSLRVAPVASVVLYLGTLVSALTGPMLAYGVAQGVGALTRGESVWPAVILVGVLAAVSMLTGATSAGVLETVGNKCLIHLRGRLMTTVGALPTVAHHDDPAVADRIETASRDLFKVGTGTQLIGLLGAGVRVVTVVGLLVSIHPVLVLLLVTAAVPPWLEAAGERARHRTWVANERYRRLATGLSDILRDPALGVELRCFGMGRPILDALHTAFEVRVRPWRRTTVRYGALSTAGWVVSGVATAAALVWLALRVGSGAAQVEQLVLFIGLITQISAISAAVTGTISVAAQSLQMFEGLEWLRAHAASTDTGGTAAPPGALAQGIRLEGVSFAYPGAAGHDIALRRIDLDLPAGTTVALVGANGAGKSTLVKLLAGLRTPTGGSVLVDGVPLAAIAPDAWKLRVSAGFQDFMRLKLPARLAIGAGDLPHADDERRVLAAARTGEAASIVEGLPHGMDTQLGPEYPDGVDLSGGQWQRIALARAFMRTQPLLMLLDEPTAALDPETEARILDRYTEVSREVAARTGAITVLVAHRFSTVRQADLIVVVDDGVVAEAGRHEDLLAADGRYAAMFRAQAAAYE